VIDDTDIDQNFIPDYNKPMNQQQKQDVTTAIWPKIGLLNYCTTMYIVIPIHCTAYLFFQFFFSGSFYKTILFHRPHRIIIFMYNFSLELLVIESFTKYESYKNTVTWYQITRYILR